VGAAETEVVERERVVAAKEAGVQRTASKEEVEVRAAAIEEKEASESAEAVRVGVEAAVDQVRATSVAEVGSGEVGCGALETARRRARWPEPRATMVGPAEHVGAAGGAGRDEGDAGGAVRANGGDGEGCRARGRCRRSRQRRGRCRRSCLSQRRRWRR
jgi:hypothetical protein